MSITILLIVLVIALPLAIYKDYLNVLKEKNDPDYELDPNKNLFDDITLFIPLMALFYSEIYWSSLLYLTAMLVYAVVLATVSHKLQWRKFGTDLITYRAGGGILLSIILYFLFFDNGILSSEATADPTSTGSGNIGNDNQSVSIWPFIAYGIIFITTAVVVSLEKLGRIKPDSSGLFMIIMLIAFNILPFFTPYFWWAMLIGIIVYVMLASVVIKNMEVSVRGGMGFVLSYFYMMVATGSSAAYAILF